MEDQFGGRTDDDLFFDDDFEPVDGVATIVTNDVPVEISSYYITPSSFVPHPADIESALAPLAAAAAAAGKGNGRRRRKKSPKPAQPPPPPRGGLALSRFADTTTTNGPQHTQPRLSQQCTRTKSPARSQDQAPAEAPITHAPTPRNRRNNGGGQTKLEKDTPDLRAQSGANPRQKLTEEELTAKMEKMKLLSAEKTRKFEKAEKDEKQHAEAYARGMEEARRRRAENAEKRRQNEEQRRRLEEERQKNRERKLKAMTLKEGGWDEGKETVRDDETHRPFRGANGGVRSSKASRGSGLRGSRFARDASERDTASDRADSDKSVDEPRRGGRGGRGGRGRGRGGRGRGIGSEGRSARSGHASQDRSPPAAATVPSTDKPPSLPLQPEPIVAAEGAAKPFVMAPLPRFAPAIGKWDDEMEYLDEINNATASKS